MLSQAPLIQELPRGLVAQRRVPSRPVVEHLNVFEARRRHRCACVIANSMDALVLEAVEAALRRRVIPAVHLATHGVDHAVFPQLVLEGLSGVLAAPIRVMHQSYCKLPRQGDSFNGELLASS